jgi:EAL domain-containing protein (putative c-di-GMP-specific phosphodiesterase class I)
LARGLAVKTVAEGVETVAQFERLRELGCNEVQGYLFSEAVEPERAFAMLGERIGVA